MSVAQETPATVVKAPHAQPPRHNGRWSGYTHLLMARMLELKREPEVVFWVFVFPLLLALGLGIAFRNKPADAVPLAIVQGSGSAEAEALLQLSPQHASFKVNVESADVARKGLRLGNLPQIRDIVAEEVEGALNGTKTPKEALDNAVTRGNALLRTFEKTAS